MNLILNCNNFETPLYIANYLFRRGSFMTFKEKAKGYDNNSREKRSQIIAEKIISIIEDAQSRVALEYGCATGLISFNLMDKFRSLTLIDSEEEMVNIVSKKVQYGNISNIYPIKKDLTKEKYDEKFDVIFTSLTLHHIVDVENIIKTFYGMLNKDGVLIIIDLDKEDGSFHMDTKDFSGHNGFEHEYIENILKQVGLLNIKSETFFYSEKKIINKNIPYSLFYTVGYKK